MFEIIFSKALQIRGFFHMKEAVIFRNKMITCYSYQD